MEKSIVVPDSIMKEYEIINKEFILFNPTEEISHAERRAKLSKNERLWTRFQTVLQETYQEPVSSILFERALFIITCALRRHYKPERMITYLFDELYYDNVFSFVDITDMINTALEKLQEEDIKIPKFRYNNKLVTVTKATVRFGNRENNPRKLRLVLSGYNQRGVSITDETREVLLKEAYKIGYKLEWTYEHRKENP